MNVSYGAIWKLAYPILISMLMQQLIGITDVIYMGRLSETALGASALGATYFFTFFIVSFGFSVGAQIIMARRNGEGRFAKIGAVLYQGGSFLLLYSVLLILLIYTLTPLILDTIIENKEIALATQDYMNWRIWGLTAASLLMIIRAFFVAITSTVILTIVSLLMVTANVALNYIFIFGRFGVPAMGISGAAFASNISEFLALLAYVVYFACCVDIKKYGLNQLVYKNLRLLKSILKVSVWTMLQQFISVSTWFLFFVAIEHLSERALAVSNIVRSLSSFPYVVVNAMAAAASSITSNLIGSKQMSSVIPSCHKIIRLCAAVLLPMIALMIIFIVPCLKVYTDNQELIYASVDTAMVMFSSFLPLMVGWILFNAVSGTGNTRYAMTIELRAMAAYMLYIGVVVLYLKSPLPICWLSDWVYNLVILIVSAKYMYSKKWRNQKI